MRGDITLFILKTIQGGAKTADAISDAINSYSISNANRRFWGGMAKTKIRKPLFEKKIAILETRKRIMKTIVNLRNQGLVLKNKKDFFNITKNGIAKVLRLEKLKSFQPEYGIRSSDEIKIIVFDIPESQRIDRYWLRLALKNLKFTFLQKSVWVGKTIIPEDFLDDLHERGIFDFVEILAVTKKGTLRQIQ